MNSTTSRYRRRASIFACLWAACVLLGAVTAPAATLTLVPPTGEFHCGNTWTIDVVLDGATVDLRGFSLLIAYDNSIISPYNVSVGSLVLGATCPNFLSWVVPPSTSTLKVDVANLGCSGWYVADLCRCRHYRRCGGISKQCGLGDDRLFNFPALGAPQVHFHAACSVQRVDLTVERLIAPT